MNLCQAIDTNKQLSEIIQMVGNKLLGDVKDRTQINKSFLAIYFINLIVLEDKRFLEAYNTIGKENILISLYHSEILLEEIAQNFLENDLCQIVRLLSHFLINLATNTLNSKTTPS
ncbi:hypothetical protein DMR_09980 [Solidesulfovibrio magneticus RS-1]|uniref:Uncharacterized protein n=1 Tax=Solidesulfovibrio magneticus (strain ATCC 700980 / DSM 13731 / RS-1) TaxID=573370 RepID=C4XKV0_SOLM1|nr:hypothetical protein DMR_09980 [Solidesulfovibrio magneticus RS-1]